MPTFKDKDGDSHGLLSVILALRLAQIEESHKNYVAFVKKTGLSRGTLYALRHGHSNPTFQTIERLARFLGEPVFGLLGISEDHARGDFKRSGFDYDELKAQVAKAQRARKPLAKALAKGGKAKRS
jgi:transcriptional regulator with XRE-family HTH domain